MTGSVGKTSTKDLIAAACSATLRTTANERSFNNEQGLPITILNAPDDTEVLVLEMGMRGFGQISSLCEVARPEIGVVTAVGHSHTELVGGIDGVQRAKRELIEALPRSGTAVLNADDDRVAAMADHTRATVVTFGHTGDVRIVDLELDALARPRFTLDTPWGTIRVELAVSGEHMAMNAAAAIAVAGSLGVPVDAAADAVAGAAISGMRMEVAELPSGAIVINDAYNANPTSMAAALDALLAMNAERRFAVLGLMGELDDPGEGHRDVARRAEALGVELIAVGTDLYGVRPTDDPVGALGDLGDGDVVLVKASRSAGLERVVARSSSADELRIARPAHRDVGRAGGSPPSASGRKADGGWRRRSSHHARNSAQAAPAPSTARGPIDLEQHAADQVADRHGAAEHHEPQRHHRGSLAVLHVELERRRDRRGGHEVEEPEHEPDEER